MSNWPKSKWICPNEIDNRQTIGLDIKAQEYCSPGEDSETPGSSSTHRPVLHCGRADYPPQNVYSPTFHRLCILLDLYFCYSNYRICPQHLIKSMPHLHWKSFASWQRSQNQIWPLQQGAARQKSRKNTLMHFLRQPEGAIWVQMHGTHFDWPGPNQNLISMVQGTVDWTDKICWGLSTPLFYIHTPHILTSHQCSLSGFVLLLLYSCPTLALLSCVGACKPVYIYKGLFRFIYMFALSHFLAISPVLLVCLTVFFVCLSPTWKISQKFPIFYTYSAVKNPPKTKSSQFECQIATTCDSLNARIRCHLIDYRAIYGGAGEQSNCHLFFCNPQQKAKKETGLSSLHKRLI